MEPFAGISSELRSSINQVISSDDLLTEILHRLPVISLLPFKLVSKHWLSLIKSPNFTFCQNRNIEPPSGLFIELQNFSVEYNFVQLDNATSSPVPTVFPFGSDSGNVEILHSCNGLLLCFIRPFKLFVFNPSTNQFKMLPDEHYSKLAKIITGVKLVFDPTKSREYKVVYAGVIYEHDNDLLPSVEIKTYSSETGNWSVFPDRFPTRLFSEFDQSVYFDGAIHWLKDWDVHYKLDANDLVLTTIEKPDTTTTVDGKMIYDHKLFEYRTCLYLVCIQYTYSTNSRKLNVYEMTNASSVWSVKYFIDHDYYMSLIPKNLETPGGKRICLRCISIGETEEDSFIVIEVFGKVFRYKFVLKTLTKIFDFIPPVLEPIGFHCFPFIPSLADV